MEQKLVVTPVLSTKVGYLEDVRDQIMTIVRFIIMNPGFTSSLWEEDMVSLRKLVAAHEADRENMCNQLSVSVNALFKRLFKDIETDCQFTTKNYDLDNNVDHDDGRYTVTFSIFITKIDQQAGAPDINHEPALISGTIFVDPITNDISLKYERTADTHALIL